MPQPERATLHHHAVLWESSGTDEYSRPLLTAPVEVHCRWVNVKRAAMGPATQNVSWDAEVMVDRYVTPGGSVMWLGRLRDLPAGTAYPDTDGGLFAVDSCDSVDDVRARVTQYELKLTRLGHGLPESA